MPTSISAWLISNNPTFVCVFDCRYFGIDAKDNDRLNNVVDILNDNFVSTILEVKDLIGKMLFRFCGNFQICFKQCAFFFS